MDSAAILTPDARSMRRLAWAFAGLAGVAYVLIVFGALVRAYQAGLSCPDWPLCHGGVVPPLLDEGALRRNLVDAGILRHGEATAHGLPFQVLMEWGHRALVGVLSVGLLVASTSVFLDPRARRAAGSLVATVLGVLGVQIVLGGLTVLHLLARWTVTSHLVVGNLFAIGLALTAGALFRASRGEAARLVGVGRGFRTATVAAGTVLSLQMVAGGLVSSGQAGLACGEWPTCVDGVWFPTFAGGMGVQIVHRLLAYGSAIAFALLAWASRGQPGPVPRLAGIAFLLVLVQIAVGIANVLFHVPVGVTGLHSALAAALCMTTAHVVLEAFRRPMLVPQRRESVPAGARVTA